MNVDALIYVVGMCCVVLVYVFRRKIFKDGDQISLAQVELKVVRWFIVLLVMVAVTFFIYEVLS